MTVIYEDNHLIVVNKESSEIVQGDKTGDETLGDLVKDFLRVKYNKPGNIFCGVTHRLDRPVTGAVVMAKTSKALTRMNDLFRNGDVRKIYWAVVDKLPPNDEGTLIHYISKDEKNNKSHAHQKERSNAKRAELHYKVIGRSDRYYLLEVELKTGRHHQIRCQLASIGCPIRGDLKYGYERSNPGGGISLHSRSVSFVHPVSKEPLHIVAPTPKKDSLWQFFEDATR